MNGIQHDKAVRFRALHERPGVFVIPNPWDVASARLLAGRMAACLQGSLLVRFAPSAVADAFCATRLGTDYGGTLGTLPAGTDLGAIVERATPGV